MVRIACGEPPIQNKSIQIYFADSAVWLRKEGIMFVLPPLHEECVPPDFRFPVGFESAIRKHKYFISLSVFVSFAYHKQMFSLAWIMTP